MMISKEMVSEWLKWHWIAIKMMLQNINMWAMKERFELGFLGHIAPQSKFHNSSIGSCSVVILQWWHLRRGHLFPFAVICIHVPDTRLHLWICHKNKNTRMTILQSVLSIIKHCKIFHRNIGPKHPCFFSVVPLRASSGVCFWGLLYRGIGVQKSEMNWRSVAQLTRWRLRTWMQSLHEYIQSCSQSQGTVSVHPYALDRQPPHQ